jgi:hypothetical protein
VGDIGSGHRCGAGARCSALPELTPTKTRALAMAPVADGRCLALDQVTGGRLLCNGHGRRGPQALTLRSPTRRRPSPWMRAQRLPTNAKGRGSDPRPPTRQRPPRPRHCSSRAAAAPASVSASLAGRGCVPQQRSKTTMLWWLRGSEVGKPRRRASDCGAGRSQGVLRPRQRAPSSPRPRRAIRMLPPRPAPSSPRKLAFPACWAGSAGSSAVRSRGQAPRCWPRPRFSLAGRWKICRGLSGLGGCAAAEPAAHQIDFGQSRASDVLG